MSIIALLERFNATSSDAPELERHLAIGQALITISKTFKEDEVSTDEAFSKTMSQLSDDFFVKISIKSKKDLEDGVAAMVGRTFGDLKAPIQENHTITKENKGNIENLKGEVSSILRSIKRLEGVVKSEPWKMFNFWHFVFAVGASLLASLLVSVIIGWYNLEARLEHVDKIVQIYCANNPNDC